MDREQFINGDEIVDYWGYLKSVSEANCFAIDTNLIKRMKNMVFNVKLSELGNFWNDFRLTGMIPG